MDDQETGQSDNLKDLRRAAEDGKAARAETESFRRELAFMKAGVDTESKLGKLLLKTYEGELTVEAIQVEARDVGAFLPDRGVNGEIADDRERSQSRERMNLSSESGPVGGTAGSAHPNEVAREAFDAAMRAGDPRDIAAGAAFAEILKAAHRGDERIFLR